MRLSNAARTIIIVILVFGAADLPAKASIGPRGQVPVPSGRSKQGASRQPSSTATKQAGTLIEYRNAQYGFCFSLPEGWRGYSIVPDQWRGDTSGPNGDLTVQRGPIISIRHPRWTSADPRQDIPIMVFTLAQWRSLQHERFIVSAAPIGPSELGRNRRYVFSLPPRYNYAFPTGYEEVQEILSSKPLDPACKARADRDGKGK